MKGLYITYFLFCFAERLLFNREECENSVKNFLPCSFNVTILLHAAFVTVKANLCLMIQQLFIIICLSLLKITWWYVKELKLMVIMKDGCTKHKLKSIGSWKISYRNEHVDVLSLFSGLLPLVESIKKNEITMLSVWKVNHFQYLIIWPWIFNLSYKPISDKLVTFKAVVVDVESFLLLANFFVVVLLHS